jgi:inhibitor of KinA sporulation pathway (predicted exonuclease)
MLYNILLEEGGKSMAEFKQLIFFDFEMLCSGRRMSYIDMEAIRLGAVKYDIYTEEISYFDEYIKPKKVVPLSNFCKKLTGISDEDLVDARSFNEIFNEFLEWIGSVKNSRFFSWSSSDLHRLKIDADANGIPSVTVTKIEKRYTDFQAVFTKRVAKTNQTVENALKFYHLNFIGEAHNPMFDAYNTLRIYLNFENKPLQSDLVMLRQFIFENISEDINELNTKLYQCIISDIRLYFNQLRDVYGMKDAAKLVKSAKKMAEKYENIILNRSGIFSAKNIVMARHLVQFYEDLLMSYEEHFRYSSRIMILDEHIGLPIQELYLKEA